MQPAPPPDVEVLRLCSHGVAGPRRRGSSACSRRRQAKRLRHGRRDAIEHRPNDAKVVPNLGRGGHHDPERVHVVLVDVLLGNARLRCNEVARSAPAARSTRWSVGKSSVARIATKKYWSMHVQISVTVIWRRVAPVIATRVVLGGTRVRRGLRRACFGDVVRRFDHPEFVRLAGVQPWDVRPSSGAAPREMESLLGASVRHRRAARAATRPAVKGPVDQPDPLIRPGQRRTWTGKSPSRPPLGCRPSASSVPIFSSNALRMPAMWCLLLMGRSGTGTGTDDAPLRFRHRRADRTVLEPPHRVRR